MSNSNRRNFLKTVAGGAALASLESCSTVANRMIASVEEDQFYHFIVVGSGAGGGPLAARLAEKGFRVLVLEAGGDNYRRIHQTPVNHPLASEDIKSSWKFFVEHYEKTGNRFKDSKYVFGKGILYPRGNGIGGSTIQNAMITMYPDHEDWAEMEKLTGEPTWNPKNMRLYFQMIEKNNYKTSEEIVRGQHGNSGWLSTEQNPLKLLLQDLQYLKIVEAAFHHEGYIDEVQEILEKEDYHLRFDPNDIRYVNNKKDGVYNVPRATRDGLRSGPRERLLSVQEKYPKNLVIKTHSLVTKLIFSDTDAKKVIGVEVQEGENLYSADPLHEKRKLGKKRIYRCINEVILSGGAFNSPQILMLSGIGDKDELEALNIPVRHHLPAVGKNLRDRYEVSVISEMKQNFSSIEDCKFGKEQPDPCWLEYQNESKNHVYGTNGAIISLIKKSNQHLARPDLFIFGVPGFFKGYYPGYSEQVTKQKNYFSWVILKSRNKNDAGFVRLRDKNPFSTPEINFKFFQEGNQKVFEQELGIVSQGVNIARNLNSRLTSKGLIQQELVPGPNVKTKDQEREFIVNESWGHHASCSNPMGRTGDPNAVLDGKLRVQGIKGLRVVDASSFPFIPGMFIALPIYMISEKAANDLAHEYKHQLKA